MDFRTHYTRNLSAELFRERKPDLDHFCTAPRAPSSGNRMNEIAAQAPYFQLAAERVGLTLMALLGRLILNNHNGVHG